MSHIEPDLDWYDPGLAELERLSNGALDLINEGRLDEAERICRDLKDRFPDQMDWIQHSAAICEARGKVQQAIRHYERCIAHIDRYPDGFDSDGREWYRDQIERLRRR